MEYFIFIFLFVWFAYWSAESGASLPWSSRWQNYKGLPLKQLPELILAVSVAVCGVLGWDLHDTWYEAGGYGLLFTAIAYAGKQAATWAYLAWTGHKNPSTDRSSTLKPINDWIAKHLDYELGDEGYSWVWAATKGFIITAPVGFIGTILFPLGHEVGSHAEGRLPGDPNMWKELTSGAAIGISCALFLLLTL